MNFSAAALKIMLEKGLTLGDVCEIAAANETRSGAAARQARYRSRKKECDVTSDVTPLRYPAPNERDNLTPTRVTPPPSGGDPKPKKHRLPAEWEPGPFTPGTLAAQTVERWEPGRIERELSKFRDHHTAAGTRWENWQAAWSKWVNNSRDFERGGNVTGIGKSQAAYRLATANIDPDEPF